MFVLSRDLFFLLFIVRLLRCLGMAGNNHPKKERGTTADDGLSTRKSSWWCLCYVISGNAADGGSFSCIRSRTKFALARRRPCSGYTSSSGNAAPFLEHICNAQRMAACFRGRSTGSTS